MAERRGLAQQPTQLLDRLGLRLMLREIGLDELGERRRLDQAILLAQALKRAGAWLEASLPVFSGTGGLLVTAVRF